MIYAIIALVVLAGACGWLAWRCASAKEALGKAEARVRQLKEDRAIRQNLQQVLTRREAEIRRLRARVEAFESDYQEMETRASDLNMHLFQESGRRILAEKEDGVKRMKMEQLEQQLAEVRKQLREQSAQSDARLREQSEKAEARLHSALERRDEAAAKQEAALRREIARISAEAARTEESLRAEIAKRDAEISQRDAEIGRLQTLNARRLARKAQADTSGLNQVTLDDILKTDPSGDR